MQRKTRKCLLTLLLLSLILLFVPIGKPAKTVQASSKKTRLYKKRAKKVKKNLPKKVRKLLRKGYDSPTCKVQSAKRKGKYLTCRLAGGIGWGAYEITVVVNLKNGKARITDNMVSIPDTFKVSLK